MLLVHMTGAPVLHVASLAKPPAWLFFFADMPRALAWYWWAPLFMGLAGVFVLLQTIWRGQTGINVAATVLFVFSMHAAAFSYWPGYGRLTTGGDWPLWGLVKGWVALTTFYTEGALMYSGQGYNLYPLLLPLLAIFVRLSWRQGQWDAVLCAVLLFMLFTLTYQYIGIPSWLAKATLWTRTHGFAAEIGMGLGQTLCLAALCNLWKNDAAQLAASFDGRKSAFAGCCHFSSGGRARFQQACPRRPTL